MRRQQSLDSVQAYVKNHFPPRSARPYSDYYDDHDFMYVLEGVHFRKASVRGKIQYVCLLSPCKKRENRLFDAECHVRSHFNPLLIKNARVETFRLTGKVRDMWALRKFNEHVEVERKADFAYPLAPAPKDPFTTPFIDLLHIVMPVLYGLNDWSCLNSPVSANKLKRVINDARDTTLMRDWIGLCKLVFFKEADSEGESRVHLDYIPHTIDRFEKLFPSATFDDMSDEERQHLDQMCDQGIIWIDAKEERVRWENSRARHLHIAAAKTNYIKWKTHHKGRILQRYRDEIYHALQVSGRSHETNILEVLSFQCL